MDMIDLKILHLLKGNSRMTSSEISKKIMLSVPAVTERIRKLEEEDIIKQYTILTNKKKFDLNIMAFIFVSIDETENLPNFKETILQSQWVMECHHITGEYDYLLKVLIENTDKLDIFLTYILKKTTGVVKTKTIISLSTLKEEL